MSDLPKLLRAIAGGTDAQASGHAVIFNAAADELDRSGSAERERCAVRLECAADAWIKDDPKAAQRLMNLATQIRLSSL